jgi:HK97 family phage major capsid protein
MASVNASTLFPHELVTEMFSKVVGRSSVAKLADQTPIPFSGVDVMTFSMDDDIAIVGEGAAKPAGDASVGTVKIVPIKVVYQSRVSDEFIHCAEEKRLVYLQAFTDGYAKKIARGLDIMVFHGLDPKSGTTSSIIGANCLDRAASVSLEAYSSAAVEGDVTAAIGAMGEGYVCNGIAMSPAFATALSQVSLSGGQRPYEDFMWGGNPGAIRGIPADVNPTVAVTASTATLLPYAYLGDWSAFRWGYAAQLPLEVIEYGNPDGGAYDLKQSNQVLLRSEAYIGWGILDPTAFARIATTA